MASTSTLADKPLPTPPTRQLNGNWKELARLSVESRAHLRLFIKHALAEENVESASSWAKGIELALYELCDAMVRGAWLAGLKEARKAEQNRRWLEEKEERETKQLEGGGYATIKGSEKWKEKTPKLASCEGRNQTPDVGELSEDERRRMALAQMSKAITTHKTPSPRTKPSHLLLTLSPRNAILPAQNNAHDIQPTKTMCLFTVDKYMLPSTDDCKHDTGGIVLYGLDEWDGEHVTLLQHEHDESIAILSLPQRNSLRTTQARRWDILLLGTIVYGAISFIDKSPEAVLIRLPISHS